MKEFHGQPASEGYALAPAFVYRHDSLSILHESISKEMVADELKSLSRAFDSLVDDRRLALEHAMNDEEVALLTVEVLMLEDPDFRSRVENLITDELYNASWAIERTIDENVEVLSQSDDEYLRERILDFRDIERMLLETVSGKKRAHIVLTRPSVIVSDNLLTSELLNIEGGDFLKGILLDAGGVTSHVSILARNHGIPMIVGLESFSLSVEEGELIAFDSFRGDAYGELNKKTRLFFESRISRLEDAYEELKDRIRDDRRAYTADGQRIILDSNVEDISGLEYAIENGAEGVGLFRTEFMALQAEKYPDEESRAAVYDSVASKLKEIGGSATFRTLDLGGDKRGEDSAVEENPIVGWRAIRYCLDNLDHFRAQIRSILKASRHGNVRIMFPMISGIEDLDRCLEILEEEKEGLRKRKIPFDEEMEVGTMIEVPSAALTSDILAEKVDFFSVGTNDLVQYSLAVDRGNEKVQSYYRPMHPAVLRLCRMIVDNAHSNGVRVGICGQLASDIGHVPLLVGLGFDELSVAPGTLLAVRNLVGELSAECCRKLANNVLSMRSYVEIEKEIKEFDNGRKTRNQK